MLTMSKLVILFIVKYLLISNSTITCLKGVESNEYNLIKAKFADYSKSVRPVQNWNDSVKVDINVRLNKIATVIEDHQTISIYVRLEMIWQDLNLAWDPKGFDGLQSLVLPANQIWIPDIHLFNSANEDDRIYPINIELFSNGTVITYPINHLYAHCDFDFTRFPFDFQTCDFIIGSMIDRSKLLVNIRTFVELSQILPNPEWRLVSLTDSSAYNFNAAGTFQANKEAFNLNWSVGKFSMTLKRSQAFYVNLFIWPMVFILFITMSVFILPPSCVERVTLGVLLLLSLVILTLMLESYTPKNSANVSVIGRLIGFCMFMVTCATISSTLIISIDRDSFVYRNVPQWLKNIMLRLVGKIVFKFGSLNRAFGDGNLLRDEDIEVIDPNTLLQKQRQSESEQLIDTAAEQTETATTSKTTQQTAANLDMTQAQTLLALINNQLAMFRMRLQENDLKDKNKGDWYLIAVAFDRLCLICYTIIMLLGLFIILI